MLPESTGANPPATILAGAEHAFEGLIRTITGVPGGSRAGKLRVQLEISSLDRFRADPEHRLSVGGRAV